MMRKTIVFVRLFIIYCTFFAFIAANGSTLNPPDGEAGNFTISGYVKAASNGEAMIGATVSIKELATTGAVTNSYGFYSITIPGGTYTVTAQFIGYESKSVTIELKQNTRQDFNLEETTNNLKELLITGEKKDDNLTSIQMGTDKMTIDEINSIPVLMGERDVLKSIQLLPGIKSSGDGNTGFYVRGGGADENLILLDEATVYNPSHLLGFFSVFNSDAIKDVTVYKGEQPAEYGGRLSSVLDVKMNDGDDQNYHVSGGIGLISSRLNIDGPIVKHKGSFNISARRTYADLFLKLSSDSTLRKTSLYFYDLNAKANYELGPNDKIFLSGYFGRDVLAMGTTFGINWGNATGTLRWNHLFNEKLFSNTSLIFSNYSYKINLDFSGNQGNIISRIQDYNLKEDFQYYANTKNEVKFGFNSIYHTIIPGDITAASNTPIGKLGLPDKYAWENAVYISDEYKPLDKLNFDYGVRFSSFSILGPGSFVTYAPGTVNGTSDVETDSVHYSKNSFVKTYYSIEPRFAVNYKLNKVSSIKASYGRNTQNLHLLSNATTSSPTDLWIPSSLNVKPEISNQVSLGYFRNFKDNTYEFSTEVYYKTLQNQIDYINGAELNFNQSIESQLLYGIGRAYGIEFYLKKKYGRFTGWIGYTLSRSERQFTLINNDSWYPAKQDETHDISVVGIYQLSKKWTLSFDWVYNTGNAVTFPSGKYEVNDQVVFYYTQRNGYRMPPYHRLDLGATWIRKKTAKYESSWTFSVYNAYDHWNAYSINFQTDPNNPQITQAVQTTLFGIVPAVTYNFKF
jgi:hypothetical protein